MKYDMNFKILKIMSVPLKILGITLLICVTSLVKAQDEPASLGSSINKKLEIYVFPAQGQDEEQTIKDENDCYKWAVEQSGVDPLNLPDVQVEQVETGPDGSAIRGAARGAAAGAAIGAIAGDAGEGAAIGAVAGGLRGRRASRAGRAMQQQANESAAAQTKADMIDNFKRAYSVCLEGKGYTVK
jgi:hypothetical protein